MAILSRRLIPLAIFLYKQFIHLTQITLHPNIQVLNTQQRAYQSFLVTSWFDFVCVNVTRWMKFIEKYLHKHELQLSDYNVWKVTCMKSNLYNQKWSFCQGD